MRPCLGPCPGDGWRAGGTFLGPGGGDVSRELVGKENGWEGQYLELCPCGFGVGERVDDLALRSGELSSTLEVFERFRHFALLQEELRHCGDGDVAFGVDCGEESAGFINIGIGWIRTDQRLLAQLLCLRKVLLPLE